MPADPVVLNALRAAVNADPANAPLRRHLADLLFEIGEYSEALEHYRRALDAAPQDASLKLLLASSYERLGKGEVAQVVLADLLRGSPEPAILAGAARIYLACGAAAEAALAYRRAVAADPALADAELEAQFPTAKIETAGPETLPEKLLHVSVEGKDGILVEVERPKITFKDVGGMEKVKEEIRMKIIYPMQRPEIFKAYGKTIGGGILMYGPPGCGKTYLARATAGEVQAAFISVGLHEVLDMYIGQSEQNLHKFFESARQKAPCVLFFDEVDALGANRADMRHNAMRQVINQLLAEMDGVDSSNEGVLILAATNTPWYVDAALRRPGRFDRVLFVPPPDQPAREAILRIHLKDKPVQSPDFARLARETRDFSGADLRGLVDRAIEGKLIEAMRQDKPSPLGTTDLLNALREARPTTREWFETARNYAIYSNENGLYDDILAYLKLPRGGQAPRPPGG
jgi:SpoVK/Ycf46/Vps4 family AAA+-type ATPase